MDRNFLGVDPDIAKASTIPAPAYFDSNFFERERHEVFHRTWQPVARLDQLERPGDYVTAEIAGEPVVVVRGKDSVLRALSNVCRHRASLVAIGQGNCQTLKCPYHGWTYQLDGSLFGVPEFDGVENFDRKQTRLAELSVETWGPFVFVRMAPSGPSLREMLGAIPGEVEKAGFPLDGYRFLTRKDYVIDCNWKVYVDNYLEGYHIPTAHPGLFREIDYKQYRVDAFRYYASQYAPLSPRKQTKAGDDTRRYDPANGPTDALYYWLFPNFMVNFYPDNMSSNLIVPLGPERTLTIFEWFLPKERGEVGAEVLEDTIAFSDQVQAEDILICQRVQKGLRSTTYERGRYSVRRENGVHHFHRLLQEFLSPPRARSIPTTEKAAQRESSALQ